MRTLPAHDPIRLDAEKVARRLGPSDSLGQDIIVAGGTGLVGRYVIATLQAMQRLYGYHQRLWSISGSITNPKLANESVRHVNVDLRRPDPQAHVSLPPKATCLIFAAGYGQPSKFMGSPLDSLSINVTGLAWLMERVADGGHVLYLSSAEVYSGLTEGPFTEEKLGTTGPTHPRAHYIEAKRAGEALALAASDRGRLTVSVARLALAYGPGTRADDGRVLNEFIRSALTRGLVTMRDPGRHKRTYCYVSDAVDMMLWMLMNSQSGVFNVGGESRTSIRQLAQLVARYCGAHLTVPEGPDDGLPGAPGDVWLSLNKLRKAGYQGNLTPLEVGLPRTIDWQRNNLYTNVPRFQQ